MRKRTALVVMLVMIASFASLLAGCGGTPKEFETIPGYKSAEMVSESGFKQVWRVRVAQKDKEWDCILTLNIDAGGNVIYPEKDEIFTTVLIESSGYELFGNSGKLGILSGIFITKLDEKGFLAGKPGSEKKPVEITPGAINKVSFEKDTVVTGPDGLTVRVLVGREEIASGRLPLNLNLGGEKATVEIEGMFVSKKISSGLIHVFSGSQPISPGSNQIKPSAQSVGSEVWFHKGAFVGFQDGICFVSDVDMVYFRQDGKEKTLSTPMIDTSRGVVLLGNSLFWVGRDGTLNRTSSDGNVTGSDFYVTERLELSGKYIIAGKKVIDSSLSGIAGLSYWNWTKDGVFMTLDNGTLECSGKKSWTAKTDITAGARLESIDAKRAFFSLGGKVTQEFDVETGEFSDPEGLMLTGSGEINFPDGVFVSDGVQTDINGKSVWSRKGWDVSRIGSAGVYARNADTGEAEVIAHDTGLKALFWQGDNVKPLVLTTDYCVFSLDGFVVSIERTLPTNKDE